MIFHLQRAELSLNVTTGRSSASDSESSSAWAVIKPWPLLHMLQLYSTLYTYLETEIEKGLKAAPGDICAHCREN